ncbi:hypothetical protein [Nocardia sp. NPDC004711]
MMIPTRQSADLMAGHWDTLAEQTADPLVTALVAHHTATVALAVGDADESRADSRLADAARSYAACGDLESQLNARISFGWI